MLQTPYTIISVILRLEASHINYYINDKTNNRTDADYSNKIIERYYDTRN